MCFSLVRNTNGPKTLLGTRMHHGGPGILVCRPKLSIGDFLETDARLVWLEVAGVRVYSCYFSPNDPNEIFQTQILLLEKSLREASGRSLIAGDFNSKSPKWDVGRGGKVRSPSWSTQRLRKDKLREHFEKTMLIDELGWARSAGSLEDTVGAGRRKLVAECDHSMPRSGHGRTEDSMYWWNVHLSVLRRKCLTARRRFTPSKGDPLLREAWKKAKSTLRQGTKKSRIQCWKDLIGEVEKEPWGLTFKIVTKRLVTGRKTLGPDNPDRVKYIVRSLFPCVEPFQRQDRSSCVKNSSLSKN